MKSKVLLVGCALELIYLVYLIAISLPTLELTPLVVELSKHGLFQIVVLTIILVGAFSGNDKE